MTLQTFNYNSVGGSIKKTLGYTIQTGNYRVSFNLLSGATERAYWQYDTSSLGSNAIISMIEGKFEPSVSQTPPLCDILYVYIGNFIGTSLDSSDWSGGNSTGIDIFYFGFSTWFDLSTDGIFDATQYVNVNGTTDISVRSTETATESYAFEGLKTRSQIRVTYTVPIKFVSRLATLGAGCYFLLFMKPVFVVLLKICRIKKTKIFNPINSYFI